MPTLEWMGKDKVVNHHRSVPYRVLVRDDEKSVLDSHGSDCGNMVIHGDNLEALKALLPEYEGKVDCIYIDPPYNTGNEGWVYNDNVKDPRIQKWLGEVVGKEGEDFSRHDKWLCMMYPRLQLLRRLLSPYGCLTISIGYQELSALELVCKEIFADHNVRAVTVQTSGGKPSQGFNVLHEYLLFVSPTDFVPNPLDFNGGNARSPFEGLTLSTFNKTQRPNQCYPIFIDKETGCIAGLGKSLQELVDDGEYTGDLADYAYQTDAPTGTSAVWPITSKGKQCVWRLTPERLSCDWKKGYIKVSPNTYRECPNTWSVQYLPSGVIRKVESGDLSIIGKEAGRPTLLFGDNHTVGGQIPTIWLEKSFRTTNGTAELESIFSDKDAQVFSYPKPISLVESVIRATAGKHALVLDSFAGSGTTGNAVVNLNKADGGDRRFILIEMMDYADSVTAERQRRQIKGFRGKTNQVKKLYSKKLTKSNLKYCETYYQEALEAKKIGEEKNIYKQIDGPLIDENTIVVVAARDKSYSVPGVDSGFSFYELGPALFVDDGSLNPEVSREDLKRYVWYTETKSDYTDFSNEHPYLLGKSGDTVYYLAFEPDVETVLDYELLSGLTRAGQPTVVYADRCGLSPELLDTYNVRFKQIPRQIARF